jgi:hypothetical protein
LDSDLAVSSAADLYANCFVGKPANQDEFREAVRKIQRFWLTLVRRPPRSN